MCGYVRVFDTAVVFISHVVDHGSRVLCECSSREQTNLVCLFFRLGSHGREQGEVRGGVEAAGGCWRPHWRDRRLAMHTGAPDVCTYIRAYPCCGLVRFASSCIGVFTYVFSRGDVFALMRTHVLTGTKIRCTAMQLPGEQQGLRASRLQVQVAPRVGVGQKDL